jgi:hypothetical protein
MSLARHKGSSVRVSVRWLGLQGNTSAMPTSRERRTDQGTGFTVLLSSENATRSDLSTALSTSARCVACTHGETKPLAVARQRMECQKLQTRTCSGKQAMTRRRLPQYLGGLRNEQIDELNVVPARLLAAQRKPQSRPCVHHVFQLR